MLPVLLSVVLGGGPVAGQIIVPLPREDVPTETNEAKPVEPKTQNGVRARITPWINASFLGGGTAALALSGLQLSTASMGAAAVGGLAALAAVRGPVTLTRGEVPLPDRPSRFGGPWSLSWNYTTNELAVLLGFLSTLPLGASLLLASAGLTMMSAGTVFPAVDARGFGRFALRVLSFHAVAAVLVVGTLVVGLFAMGAPLTVFMLWRGAPTAGIPVPAQVGPLMLVGAALGIGGMAVLSATALQLAWTSVWGPPVEDLPAT